MPKAFKIILLLLKASYNYKQLIIISAIISFSSGKLLGLKRNWMLVLFNSITYIKLLRNGISNCKFRRIYLYFNFLSGVKIN
jgi:hypothetical protein